MFTKPYQTCTENHKPCICFRKHPLKKLPSVATQTVFVSNHNFGDVSPPLNNAYVLNFSKYRNAINSNWGLKIRGNRKNISIQDFRNYRIVIKSNRGFEMRRGRNNACVQKSSNDFNVINSNCDCMMRGGRMNDFVQKLGNHRIVIKSICGFNMRRSRDNTSVQNLSNSQLDETRGRLVICLAGLWYWTLVTSKRRCPLAGVGKLIFLFLGPPTKGWSWYPKFESSFTRVMPRRWGAH
jgi:hypothetical protein